MFDPAQALRDLNPSKDFLVAIDSDGCAFDSMGVKQSECFCPAMIDFFGLQKVAEAAIECKESADLYSKTRGSNRHVTIVRILIELLPNHPLVKEASFEVPQFRYYCEWVNDPKSLLSNEGLQQAVDNADNPKQKAELQQALAWSIKVNELVADLDKAMPPFSYVSESIKKVSQKADVIVCSATPSEALEREWAEHGLAEYVKVIAGQEMGKKAEHLAIVSDGKYDTDKIIMLGDAPGDHKAAKSNGLMYYPINPGGEDKSWKRFHDEAFEKFVDGEYSGEYENAIIAEYDLCLPEHPSW